MDPNGSDSVPKKFFFKIDFEKSQMTTKTLKITQHEKSRTLVKSA